MAGEAENSIVLDKSVPTCSYCSGPWDGESHDWYGEWRMGGTLWLCAEHAEEFELEHGPWDGWSD